MQCCPTTTVVGVFRVDPCDTTSSRNAKIVNKINGSKMTVERADVEDLIAALKKAYNIE